MTPAGARPTDDPQAAAPQAPVAGAQREAATAAGAQRGALEPDKAPGPDNAVGTGPDVVAGAESEVPAAGSGGKARAPWRGWDPVIRVAGVVIAVVAAFLSGVFEVLLSTLRTGDLVTVWRGDPIGSGSGPLVGVSVLLAIAGNLGIAWFAVGTTGRRWALGPPWALWTLLMLFAAGVRTHEGDYLLSGDNWVALAMILVGSLSFAIYAYRMILKGIARP
jgi:hypothetical protein